MVAQGRQGPWQPRGNGLLVAVVLLSVVALVAHGAVALVLLNGTVRRPSVVFTGGPPAAVPTPSSAPTASPSRGGTPTEATGPAAGSALHLDHACLVSDNPPTTARIPQGDPFGTDLSELGQGAALQRLYVLQNGALTPADGAGPVRDCDRQLWEVVAATTPPDVLRYVDQLLVFDADLGASSDLYVGEVISPADGAERASHWRLSLAPNGATDLDVAITVAHEIGHLLSLSAGQMTGEDENSCGTIYVDEGCLKGDSALLSFVDDTWSDSQLADWSTASDTADAMKREAALQKFHDDQAASFVDSYAATDPTEDFAESFGVWCALGPGSTVLPDVIEGAPTNGAGKLAWFDRTDNAAIHTARAGCDALRSMTR